MTALPESFRAIILDIEGTTTPISFVYDVLFPYARQQLRNFLSQNWNTPEIEQIITQLREQVRQDLQEQLADVPPIAEPSSTKQDILDSAVQNLLWQMDHDRKTTPLKTLQGLIWDDGYASGELKGVVFDDVEPAFVAWRDKNVPLYIYSSGSVAAQKLLFKHSVAGDLTPMIKGYFDTTTGPKKATASYLAIAEIVDISPREIIFATDNLDEARAARQAGIHVVVMDRPGNHALAPHDFPVLTTLAPLS